FTAYAGIETEGEFNLTVGYSSLLVIDLDDYSNPSALHILEAIKILGIEVNIVAIFPDELGKHSAIFVCLGLNTFNHILTDEQGQALADYVSNGGFLYLEGGDTWAFDPPTPVHPMFHINGIFHGNYDLTTVCGVDNTFTRDLSFDYIGPNILIDYIEPVTGSEAFTIFTNSSPVYDCAVAFDGPEYKTIGSSFEFGGLSKDMINIIGLMEKYLNFFQIEKLPDAPSAPTGPLQVCQDSQDELYTTSSVEGANQYVWFSDPPEAIVQTYSPDTATFIHWNETFIGTAKLYVCASNSSGIGFESESIEVMVTVLPIASIWGSDTICEGDSTDFTIKCTGNGPWNVTVIDSTHQIEIVTSPYSFWITPTETMDITILSVVDSYGCENEGDGIATVYLHQIPDMPTTPEGPSEVHSNETPITEYSILPDTSILQYIWAISPPGAGILEMDYVNCTVTWTPDFNGVAQLNVQGENACGVGPSSASLEINVENSFGLSEAIISSYFIVSPNPATDKVTIRYSLPDVGYRIIELFSISGVIIERFEDEINTPGEYEIEIDVSDLPTGVYLVRMQVGDAAIFQKMVKL
ncbi:MAG: T9SS type A sorting domain-containing protein, partial [Bacteroidota bacterium]|nr:T9SS type A sorting domain-containing protein [Bacteroidota bacterium]